MFVHASLQIDLVLNKLIMALAEKLTHENAGASISRGVIVSIRRQPKLRLAQSSNQFNYPHLFSLASPGLLVALMSPR